MRRGETLKRGFRAGGNEGESGMRAVFFVVAVLIVCGAVSRSIWLKTRTVVIGYEVRKLRDVAADLRADNDKVRADIAVLSTMRSVERLRESVEARSRFGSSRSGDDASPSVASGVKN